MLTDLFLALSTRWRHRLLRLTGTYEGVHDWLEGLCPCGGDDE